MENFFRSNQGMKSRVTSIHFDDYSIRDLVQIFERMARDQNFHLADGTLEKVERVIAHSKQQHGESFGNAREVRHIFKQAVRFNLPARLPAVLKEVSNQDLKTLYRKTSLSQTYKVGIRHQSFRNG